MKTKKKEFNQTELSTICRQLKLPLNDKYDTKNHFVEINNKVKDYSKIEKQNLNDHFPNIKKKVDNEKVKRLK